ncbi:MAG TPA: acyltransferase [Gammaproteobacteria bacterium]|nr:acyltransferase [Gammaproteobacteria bacterium]
MNWHNLKHRFLIRLAAALQQVADAAACHNPPTFANTPRNLIIQFPRRIHGSENISVGDDVYLGPNALLNAIRQYPGSIMGNDLYPTSPVHYQPRIEIGSHVSSTGGLQVSAVEHICIEDDVMFAANVNITDALHGFETADIPYKYQPLFRSAPIRIGKGSWIGQNVVILPGVTIGEQCIIGANSTVTKSIPARSIAFGNPARVHKQWNATSRQWEPVAQPAE